MPVIDKKKRKELAEKFTPAGPKAERTREERQKGETSRRVSQEFEQRDIERRQGKLDIGTDPSPREIRAFEEGRTPKFKDQILDIETEKPGFFSIQGQKERLEAMVGSEAGQIAAIGLSATPSVGLAGRIGGIAGKGIKVIKKADELIPFINVDKVVRLRGLVGKRAASTARGLTRELGHRRVSAIADAEVGLRYAANPKSRALTIGWLGKIGIAGFIIKTISDLYGTYPFASFGKEETLQSISFPMSKAIGLGLFDLAKKLLGQSNAIVDATPTISEKIPHVNVQKEFQGFIKQQAENNEAWAIIIDEGQLQQEEKIFQEEQKQKEAERGL